MTGTKKTKDLLHPFRAAANLVQALEDADVLHASVAFDVTTESGRKVTITVTTFRENDKAVGRFEVDDD